jgi:transcriptional regulator with XRE-family HTH domain
VKVVVESRLLELWTAKERRENRRITIAEICKATNLSRNTISDLLRGRTTRFDASVLAKLCEYFGVGDGEPVPFLKVRYVDDAL